MHLVYLPNPHPQNSIDIGLLCVSATSLDHVINAKEIPHISDDLVGMDAFTSITLDKSLTKERVQTQLATKVQSLVCISTVISFFFLICPPRPDTWSQLVWTCLFSVPQITRLVFPPLCLPCESFIALVTQNKISLTSKGMAMRDNIPMSRSLSCPNLTRSSRSKYDYSKC